MGNPGASIEAGEWWAVLTNGEWFCGKKDLSKVPNGAGQQGRGSGESDGSGRLLSLQKLTIAMGIKENEQGQTRPVVSFLTYPWFMDTLNIPAHSLWLNVGAFNNVAACKVIIEQTERVKIEQRAERAGLVIARASH